MGLAIQYSIISLCIVLSVIRVFRLICPGWSNLGQRWLIRWMVHQRYSVRLQRLGRAWAVPIGPQPGSGCAECAHRCAIARQPMRLGPGRSASAVTRPWTASPAHLARPRTGVERRDQIIDGIARPSEPAQDGQRAP